MKWRCEQSQIKPEKCFRGFNGIQTRGLWVIATVLHQLSSEDPHVGDRPIYWVDGIRERMKHISIMWAANIQMKWRCDHRCCDYNLSTRKLSPKIVFELSWWSTAALTPRVRIPLKPRKHFSGLICECLNRDHNCDDHIFTLFHIILI